MITKVGNLPCIPLECTIGREITRKFDFTNDKGEHIVGERSAVQISFVDCDGIPTIGVATKVKGFECAFGEYMGKQCILFVNSFRLESSGMCLFSVSGVKIPDADDLSGVARELKHK